LNGIALGGAVSKDIPLKSIASKISAIREKPFKIRTLMGQR